MNVTKYTNDLLQHSTIKLKNIMLKDVIPLKEDLDQRCLTLSGSHLNHILLCGLKS